MEQVVLNNGEIETADVVVVGVGVTPRVELAAAAGLKVDSGIVVDDHVRSGAAGVYAAGDVASAWHPHYGHHLRIEHWSNALNQDLAAGVNAAGGRDTYTRLPYFSDQYDLGMEYVGYRGPGDAVVVRGNLADRGVHRLLAPGRHRDRSHERERLGGGRGPQGHVTGRRALDPARLADPAVPLGELA